ncbi:fibronectin type III domain-containing protein [Candidatus Poriferisodalis sp.]|uniref:fibronectin type III domain-containing protein n=1 Tax=Candidatus Poriferisodalis sp. TaxID=3101277 RepID=UPI003B51F3AA
MAAQGPTKRTPRRRRILAAVIAATLAGITAPTLPAAADTPAVAARPTGLRVTAAAHDQITIAWDDPGDASITGYQVLRRLRDSYQIGRFDIIAADTATAGTVFTDTDVTASTRYVYRVKAINAVGISAQSTFLRARSPPPPPSDNNPDNGDDNSGAVTPDTAIIRSDIPHPDKLTGDETDFVRSTVFVDPPLLVSSMQTVVAADFGRYGDVGLASANSDPKSMWSDGTTLWVGDDADEKVYGYELAGGSRVSSKDIAGVTAQAVIVTGFGDRLWTGDEANPGADNEHPHAYAYDLPGLARSSGHDFALRRIVGSDFVGATSNRAMTSDGNHLWVADTTEVVQAFALFDDPETAGDDTGAKDTDADIDFDDNGDGFAPYGIFTDGETVWGVERANSTARAISLADGERVAALEFELHADNDHPRAIWSNGVTMFVLDDDDNKIYTYRIGVPEVLGVPVGGVAHVSAGGYHSCALSGTDADTEVTCSGGYASLGSDAAVPSAGSSRHYETVTAGGFHSCALLDNGTVKCWGNNKYGQAPADRSHTDTTLEYISVDAGVWHTCAVVSDGSLDCWGRNDDTQLDAPELGTGLEWIQVSAGGYLAGIRTDEGSSHSRTCGLVIDGTVRCWGDVSFALDQVPPAGGSHFYTLVSVGGAQACATRSDGALVCWGDPAPLRGAGDLGTAPQIDCDTDSASSDDGSAQRCRAVIFSPTGRGWDSVSVGVWHSCGTTGGEMFCWGNRTWFDDSGKAHHHPQHDPLWAYNAPRSAQPDNARHASAGYWHTCWTYGTETAPKVICTGDNGLRQARWKKKSLG